MENKIIYLKDALANKTPAEILDMMPFMICIEKHQPECKDATNNSIYFKAFVKRESYAVIGVTKESILLGTKVYSENDDDFGFSPYTVHDSYIELRLDKLENVIEDFNNASSNHYSNGSKKYIYNGVYEERYVFCHECTQKQKEFLVKYCDIDKYEAISGYEAFHLIQEKTSQWQKQKQKKKGRGYDDHVLGILEGMDMQDFVDSGFYFDEPY